MEGWKISWKGGTLPSQSTIVFNESDVKRVYVNVRRFGGKNLKVSHFTESYAQIKSRERAMGIR